MTFKFFFCEIFYVLQERPSSPTLEVLQVLPWKSIKSSTENLQFLKGRYFSLLRKFLKSSMQISNFLRKMLASILEGLQVLYRKFSKEVINNFLGRLSFLLWDPLNSPKKTSKSPTEVFQVSQERLWSLLRKSPTFYGRC